MLRRIIGKLTGGQSRVDRGDAAAAAAVPVAPDLFLFRHSGTASAADFETLEERYQSSTDQAAITVDIINLFTSRPELARLASRSHLYRSLHPSSVTIRLAVLAALYCEGRDADAVAVSRELVEIADSPLMRALASRAAWAHRGFEAERRVLDDGLVRFPDSTLLRFHLISHLINSNQIVAANERILVDLAAIRADLAGEIGPAIANQADLEVAIAEQRLEIPAERDIYSDDFVRSMWLSYYESFVTRSPRQHGDAAIGSQYAALIADLAASCDVIVDFGAMCGQWLADAASAHPGVTFFGSDRQPLIRELNARAYPLGNLQFRDGDIFDTFREAARLPGRKAMIHVRTACVLYPALVEKLYGFCAAEGGISEIALIEGAGMSRVSFDVADFESMAVVARVTKHKLYLHDYKNVLRRAGYGIRRWQRQPSLGLWNGFGAGGYVGSGLIVHAARD
jgi:hypothetical protein